MPTLELTDGKLLAYRVDVSMKAKSLRIKLTAREGLVVVAPHGLQQDRIDSILNQKREWIENHLKRFDEVRHLLPKETIAVRPQTIDLPALGESYCIEYHTTQSATVRAQGGIPGRLIVTGRIEDTVACHNALLRWLGRRAKEVLPPWVERLARECNLRHTKVLIKGQRTRWGSCSANGSISLNYKLLFLQPGQVRYVLIHELCHTIEMNHTQRFWVLVRGYEPRADSLHESMRDAWKSIPPWIAQGRLPGGEL